MSTQLFVSPGLARYGFADGHPLSVDRQGAFLLAARARRLERKAALMESPPAWCAVLEALVEPG